MRKITLLIPNITMKNTNTSVDEKNDSPAFTDRQINTILAGLRQIQEMLGEDPDTVLSMPHFCDCDPLTVEEIDEFCERLIIEFPTQPE